MKSRNIWLEIIVSLLFIGITFGWGIILVLSFYFYKGDFKFIGVLCYSGGMVFLFFFIMIISIYMESILSLIMPLLVLFFWIFSINKIYSEKGIYNFRLKIDKIKQNIKINNYNVNNNRSLWKSIIISIIIVIITNIFGIIGILAYFIYKGDNRFIIAFIYSLLIFILELYILNIAIISTNNFIYLILLILIFIFWIFSFNKMFSGKININIKDKIEEKKEF